LERELKFQIPAESKMALENIIKSKGGAVKRLRAKYYDTSRHSLARANMALRLRKEGHVWYQTLKVAPQAASVVRHEHNVRLTIPSGVEPHIDAALHTTFERWLDFNRVLKKNESHELRCVFETDIKRLRAPLRSRRGLIEYALDTGSISSSTSEFETSLEAAGASSSPFSLPVCEIELELISGSALALVETANRLVRDYGVWLDVRSKAMRGDALSAGRLITLPSKAQQIHVSSDMSVDSFFDEVRKECIRHLLINASQTASVEGYTAEHVHQMRVALRRLRTAIKLFSNNSTTNLQAWADQAKNLAAELGKNRDIDVMSESIWPQLRAIGAPLIEFQAHECAQSPTALIREKKVQQWFLELIKSDLQSQDLNKDTHWSEIIPVIIKWHKKCKKGAKNFSVMALEERHQLRKRMKRLRYALEFIERGENIKKFKSFNKILAATQNELGTYNDFQVALENYRQLVAVDPAAWFAVGWLQAQLHESELRCAKVLSDFVESKAPWSKTVEANHSAYASSDADSVSVS